MSGDSGNIDVRAAADLLDAFAVIGVEEHEEIGDAGEAASILDAFAKVSGRVERMPTFMEIGGYPHYENVCSNFLAFFLDPEEVHGLGTLFLDALRESLEVERDGLVFDGSISVEREVSTEKGNRIDLLITSDSCVILIENKIFAGAVNPFEDYAEHLESETFRDHTKIKILLTLKPTLQGSGHGFINVSYPMFVESVRSQLGMYASDAETRYLIIALDFLNTLENLQEGSRMNREFVELLSERKNEVEKFLDAVKAFRAEIRGKVRDLQSLVELEETENVRQYIWRDNYPMLDVLVHDIHSDGEDLIGIDTRIHPWGWQIQFFPRRAGSWPEVRSALEAAEIHFEEGWRFMYPTKFDYDEDLTVIAPVVKDLVEKIAAHHG